MERKKIAFDLDGVVYDFVKTFDNYMIDNKYKVDDITSYNLGKRYGIEKDEGIEQIIKFRKTRPFSYIPLIHNAKFEMEKLKDNKLYIITARDPRDFAAEDTMKRIKHDKLPIYNSNIIFSVHKGEWADKLGINIFYEDAPENATDIITKSNSLVKLVDTTYNRDISNKRIQRIKW